MIRVKSEIERRKKDLEKKKAENDLLNRQIDSLGTQIIELVEEIETVNEGLKFLTDLADGRRGAMKGRIESVATEALQLLYGPSYSVRLSYDIKNNRSNLMIEMVRKVEEGEICRGMGGFGGGVADTISVPLRLMVLVGSRKTDRVCILDECWKHMDVRRMDIVGKFIKALTDDLEMQVIFSSHHEILKEYADRVFNVSESNGVTKVTED